MKKISSGFSVLLLAASVCAAPSDALAQARKDGDRPGADAALAQARKDADAAWEEKKEARLKEVRKKLGLTAEQDKRLGEHKKAHWAESRRLREEKRGKREALRAALEDPAMDPAKVRALNEELKALEAKASDHRLEGILKVREILTPEQFKKFHELRSKDHDDDGRKGRREHQKKD
jgi:Spy/CpxP family protein refolding chaperone